ncbi:DMT family transporter [bacterium]|nr:DMT family transporter [bacterium]
MSLASRARGALLPAILAVSTAAIFIRGANVEPLAAAFWRSGFCAMLFACALFFPSVRSAFQQVGATRVLQIAAATLIISLHQICFVTSLSYTTIAASTFLTCTQPIFAAFLGHFFLKERVSWKSRFAILGAIAGMGIITFGSNSGEGSFTGNSLAIAASILAAIYVMFTRKFRQTTPLVPFMITVHLSAASFLLILATVTGVSLTGFPQSSWTALIFLAMIPTLIGHTLLNFAVGYLPAFVVSSSILGEPVGATFMGWIFFNEVPSVWTIVGAVVIVSCILFVVLEKAAPAAVEAD